MASLVEMRLRCNNIHQVDFESLVLKRNSSIFHSLVAILQVLLDAKLKLKNLPTQSGKLTFCPLPILTTSSYLAKAVRKPEVGQLGASTLLWSSWRR